MTKQNNFLEASNIRIKTYFEISGINIPIIVDISKIKDEQKYLLKEDSMFYKVFFEKDDVYIVDEKSPDFLYGKFQDLNTCWRILSIIHDFIDQETILDSKGSTVLQLLKLSIKKKEFCTFFMESGLVSFEELLKIYNELLFYIERTKNLFIQNITDCLDFDKSFPFISIKPKDSDIPKNLLEKASQTVGMNELSSAIEFGGTILFKENIGKSYEEWSWRERYIRRMYLDLKARTDNYVETLKCKQMET